MDENNANNPEFFKDMDPQQQEFFTLMATEEELHPDLVPYLDKTNIGICLRHPLWYELFYHPQRNAYINKGYQTKLGYVAENMEKGDYTGVLIMYERPYRLEQMLKLHYKMTDEKYWDTLGWLWTDSENLWQYRPILKTLLYDPRPGRENMMDEEEKEFLAKLPNEFVIYRGHQGKNRHGFSWTLSQGKAQWFASRYDSKKATVSTAVVKKEHVIAVFLGRNEHEIVVDPDNLKIKPFKKKSKERPVWMQEILDEAVQNFKLGKSTAHGLTHWEKVEHNGLTIAKSTKADKLVVQLFALLHDCKRVNENDDPEHGQRAAVFVEYLFKQNKLPLNESQKLLLVEACKYHNDGKTSEDVTIGTCWDADRLDLPRVGITPDPKLLSTDAARELIWRL